MDLALFFVTMGESTVAKTAVKEAATDLHHAIARFLGGNKVQEFSKIERSIHTEFHSLLGQNLKKAGIPLNDRGIYGTRAAWDSYMNFLGLLSQPRT